jgi:hypothetical protein
VITFTDEEGNFVRDIEVFPGNRQIVTNLETGKALTFVTNGPLFFALNPDGSGSVTITGPSLGLPVTSGQGLFWMSGRFVLEFDAEGNETSIDFNGRMVDVCALLAA